ncbi:13380_t:CDS:1 [Acaulospora colombiana]|uniref:13380_t:CDS:1 n=1 Tax=Acaulospora colombiana TaxID=27376 RepID=A0ACA9N1H2_9GLOM|nr:13380_t:CDS:1 [Acaulospora colombiana]
MRQVVKRAIKPTFQPCFYAFTAPNSVVSTITEGPTPSTSQPHKTTTEPLKKQIGVYDATFDVVKTMLRLGRPRKALTEANQSLSREDPSLVRQRSKFYSKIIDEFLEAGEWSKAYGLYCRMKEEDMPHQSKILRELIRSSLRMPSKPIQLEGVLQAAIASLEKIDEPVLCAVLAHLIRSRTSDMVIRKYYRRYKKTQTSTWKPSWQICALMCQSAAQHGFDDEALVWLGKGIVRVTVLSKQGQMTEEMATRAKQEVFTKLLVGSVAFDNRRPYLTAELISKMQIAGVPPTQRIANIYIKQFLDRGRVDKAFHFYRSMRHSTPPITPNSFTFRSLFYSPNTTRDWAAMSLGGRRLFRDMLRLHLGYTDHQPHKKSDVINTEVLNAALRFFMIRNDYAAATIAVRSFPVCRIPADARTRHFVLYHLLKRIRTELSTPSRNNTLRWADYMLGEVANFLADIRHGDLLRKLLATVQMTTRAMMAHKIDVRPLLALLRRALLATSCQMPGKNPELNDRLVGRLLDSANRDMLPPKAKDTGSWFMTPVAIRI